MTQVCFDVPVYDPDYEIVTVEISRPNGNYSNLLYVNNGQNATFDVDITVPAPTGKKVVGGGFEVIKASHNYAVSDPTYDYGAYYTKINDSNNGLLYNGPAADGSAWRFKAALFVSDWEAMSSDSATLYAKVYAICIAV